MEMINGMKIIKATEDLEFKVFLQEAIKDYEEIVNRVVNNINNLCKNKPNPVRKKLEMLYQYFLNLDIKYAYHVITSDGYAAGDGVLGHYKTTSNNLERDLVVNDGSYKLAPILIHTGVCASYSATFCDMARRLGIDCAVVSENHSLNHAWNAILINNEIKYLDLTPIIKSRRKDISLDMALRDRIYSFDCILITTDKYNDFGNSIDISFRGDNGKCSERDLINFLKENKIKKSNENKKPILNVRRITSVDNNVIKRSDENKKVNINVRRVTSRDNSINKADIIRNVVNKVNESLRSIKDVGPKTYKLYQLRYAVMYLSEEKNRLRIDDNSIYTDIFSEILNTLGLGLDILFTDEGMNIMRKFRR